MKKTLFLFPFTLALNAADMGSLLFHGNCTTCHFELDDKSAPAMIKVQKQYKTAFGTKKEFVKYMSEWVAHPNAEASIMQGAVNKYGLMPELAFEKDVLEEISSYIYETDFTKLHSGHTLK